MDVEYDIGWLIQAQTPTHGEDTVVCKLRAAGAFLCPYFLRSSRFSRQNILKNELKFRPQRLYVGVFFGKIYLCRNSVVRKDEELDTIESQGCTRGAGVCPNMTGGIKNESKRRK